jgi:hypothetical protein
VVIYLTVRTSGVAGFAKHLRQGRGCGNIHVHATIADEAFGGRQDPGHQRGARAHADRHLAIRALEEHTAGGKFVDVRCLDLRGPITTELGPEVVDGDKQDVRPLAACRGGQNDQGEDDGFDIHDLMLG